jgi:DNA-directed RNA polymerase specialized sigma24 family protein
VTEECDRLLGLLDDPQLRLLAVRKMEGYTVEEIALELGCVPRTVQRRLQVIRCIWQNEASA